MGRLATDLRLIAISQMLPFARRYARAMLGDRNLGDELVSLALRDVLTELEGQPEKQPRFVVTGHRLYAAISKRMRSPAEAYNAGLLRRQVLLLTALEGLSLRDIAQILDLTEAEADMLLEAARLEVRSGVSAPTLIIEDEPLIGLYLQRIVTDSGHRVVGVAASEAEAIVIAQRDPPGLILADVNLGRGGDGIAAVARIVKDRPAPAIYITGLPQSLLTSRGVEPTFVIPKPFTVEGVVAASYQAVLSGLCPVQRAAQIAAAG